jgi:hypothetical protein
MSISPKLWILITWSLDDFCSIFQGLSNDTKTVPCEFNQPEIWPILSSLQFVQIRLKGGGFTDGGKIRF